MAVEMLNPQNDIGCYKFNSIFPQIFKFNSSHIFLSICSLLDVKKGIKWSSTSTLHHQKYIILIFKGKFKLCYKRVLHLRQNKPLQFGVLFRSFVIQSTHSYPFHSVVSCFTWFYIGNVVDFKNCTKTTRTQFTFYLKIIKNDLLMRYYLLLLT